MLNIVGIFAACAVSDNVSCLLSPSTHTHTQCIDMAAYSNSNLHMSPDSNVRCSVQNQNHNYALGHRRVAIQNAPKIVAGEQQQRTTIDRCVFMPME